MLVENARPTETKKKFVIKGLKSATSIHKARVGHVAQFRWLTAETSNFLLRAGHPKLPDGFEGGTWEKLKNAVVAVQNAQAVGTSFEELYQAVESMCIHKRASALYDKLCKVCDAHTGSRVRAMAEHLGKDDPEFLRHMDVCWRQHCEQMMLIRAVFLYLDRSYVAVECQLQARSIFDMGLQQFRTHLEAQKQVLGKVVQGALLLIKAYRAREAVDSALMLSLVRMLRDLGLYATHFQGPFLAASDSAYANDGLVLVGNSSVADALEQAERRLAEEAPLCREFLDPATLEPALEVVKKQLIERHFTAYVTRGLGPLLQESRLKDLARFLRLAKLVNRQDQLREKFQEWLHEKGSALVGDVEKESGLIDSLLQLRAQMNTILAEPFCKEDVFAKAIRDAFEKFMNMRENKPGELLAKYLDLTLRSGNRKCGSETELDSHLDNALALFRYLQAKDVFEAFYKKDFAKRLLMDKSSSIDVEKSMIAKLKAECGAQYTSKLEGMFKDEQVSKDIAVQFKGSEEYKRLPAGLDVNIRVLTSGFWPSYPVVDLRLPDDIRRGRNVFGDYYLQKYNGRKLTWHSSMESCTLKAHFEQGVKDLQVSVHQACVLLLFNDADTLSFPDISSQTCIPLPELRRTLQSLALGKVRVLKKNPPKGKEVLDSDEFTFDKDFSHPLFKVKINQIQIKETVEENKRTNDQVVQDRQYQIDAAIVRTMKARKQLGHKLLVQEVMLQLTFGIKATDLKKRIENLIEREYLARAADSMDVYNYLA